MVFFSAVCAVISELTRSETVIAIASNFLEIGNGVINAARLKPPLSYFSACFATGFCGISVYFQILVAAPNVPNKAYLPTKLAYALLTTCFFILIHSFF
jgi:hypothetical protein